MQKESKNITIHQKLESLINEMVEKELTLKDSLREFEKIYIETALKKYKGNKTTIARALGIHRNTLLNLTKSLKIKIKS